LDVAKTFLEYEMPYTPLEKTALALGEAPKKVRHHTLRYNTFSGTNKLNKVFTTIACDKQPGC